MAIVVKLSKSGQHIMRQLLQRREESQIDTARRKGLKQSNQKWGILGPNRPDENFDPGIGCDMRFVLIRIGADNQVHRRLCFRGS